VVVEAEVVGAAAGEAAAEVEEGVAEEEVVVGEVEGAKLEAQQSQEVESQLSKEV
jgi:hypothetical protein